VAKVAQKFRKFARTLHAMTKIVR